MTKFTNKLNLPEPLVRAILNDPYTAGQSDVTVTGLLRPARQHGLERMYAGEVTEDVSDRIYALQGQSVHTILERAAESLKAEGWIAEQRYYHVFSGKTLGGQVDLFNPETGVLQDYKVTSVYSVKDGPKEEYVQQLNVLAELLRRNGQVVKQLQIVAILRDWSKREYEREAASCRARFGPDAFCNYPAQQVVLLNVQMLLSAYVVGWIEERIAVITAAKNAVDQSELIECTPEERWARPGKVAIMEVGKKRATKLFDTVDEAKDYVATVGAGKKFQVVERPGESIRCSSYCAYSTHCEQRKRELTKEAKNE